MTELHFATAARRSFLRKSGLLGGAAGIGCLLPLAAHAQSGNVHDIRGTVMVNGARIDLNTQIRPGDTVVTQSDGFVMVAMGQDAFMMRSRSEMVIEPMNNAAGAVVVGALRLVTGALGAVFGRSNLVRRVTTATATVGIRGTGVYLETRSRNNEIATYMCTCYGETELASTADPRDRLQLQATRHLPRWVGATARDGTRISEAPMDTHTDAEMDMLERCVGRRAPWFR